MLRYFRPRIKSRHPSHNILRERGNLPLFPFKSVIRLGSTTNLEDTTSNGGSRIEINTIESVQNSSSKLRMKHCFYNDDVKTADWWTHIQGTNDFNKSDYQGENGLEPITNIEDLPYPIISKHIYGSRGTGNIKHNNPESLGEWLEGKNTSNYIFEKFYNYNREYRLHVTESGCFYTCRKMIKSNTPTEQRWFRNDNNSVWILEDNESFDKPINWNDIIEESIKALQSVGLDIGAVDIRVQSSIDKKGESRKTPEFIIIEINSAPSFGEITAIKYLTEIPNILLKKNNLQ